jgi:hypothetical protein
MVPTRGRTDTTRPLWTLERRRMTAETVQRAESTRRFAAAS